MHEMGVVMNIVDSAGRIARRYGVSRFGYIKVDVGGLSGVMPHYLKDLWGIGTMNTILEGAELIINEVPGLVKCVDCGEEYILLENRTNDLPDCPHCHSQRFSLMPGSKDVMITEVGVPD